MGLVGGDNFLPIVFYLGFQNHARFRGEGDAVAGGKAVLTAPSRGCSIRQACGGGQRSSCVRLVRRPLPPHLGFRIASIRSVRGFAADLAGGFCVAFGVSDDFWGISVAYHVLEAG